MELKPGYKKTEIGVIPEDWEAKDLYEIADVIMGQSPNGTSYNRVGQGVPLINGPTEFTDVYPIAIQWTTEPVRFTEKGDVLLCVRGSSTGRLNISDANYCIGRGVAALRAKSQTDQSYFLYVVTNAIKRVLAITTGSTFPNIDGKSIASLRVVCPPHSEQRAIAAVLSDLDDAIRALDQLLAKKRDLKHGAMQELLTGERRLPGFGGVWEEKTFDQIFRFLATANNPRSDLSDDSDYSYIHYGDIHTKGAAFLDCASEILPMVSQSKVRNIPFVEDGDLVMVDASEDYAGIGVSVEVNNATGHQVVAGLHTILLRGDKGVLKAGFAGYLQFIPAIKSALIKAATGISVYGISKNSVKQVAVQLPTLDEQTAIAAVLSEMDDEIAALEAEREKTRALKHSMMDELLTGRTRLL